MNAQTHIQTDTGERERERRIADVADWPATIASPGAGFDSAQPCRITTLLREIDQESNADGRTFTGGNILNDFERNEIFSFSSTETTNNNARRSTNKLSKPLWTPEQTGQSDVEIVAVHACRNRQRKALRINYASRRSASAIYTSTFF